MSTAVKIQKMDFSRESDADLLEYISWRKEDDTIARQAWEEFYNRYFDLLAGICWKKYRQQIGEHEIKDLVNDTFLRVFEGAAETFKTNESAPEKLRHHVGAWLGKIAYRLFLMNLRKKNRLPVVSFEEDFDPQAKGCDPKDIDFDTPDTEASPISPERAEQCKSLQDVLATLKPRERIILLTRFKNNRASGFDPADLEQLANDWGITKEHIRQIFHRTIQKVKKQLSLS